MRLLGMNNFDPEKFVVFPNTIDPHTNYKHNKVKPDHLLKKFGIKPDTNILLTVSRLSSDEQYKGYDTIIKLLPSVIDKIPDIKYIIVGDADKHESSRIANLIEDLGLTSHVVMTGYVPSENLPDYYNLADLFVMPSKGEGFGIVYLEAMASGVPVMAGNRDGSVTPLMKGKLGFLVDPYNFNQISSTIISVLSGDVQNTDLLDPQFLSTNAFKEFGYEKFRARLNDVIRCIEQ